MSCRQDCQRIDRQQSNSRFLGDDFAVFPNVDRRAVHAGGLAGDFCGAAQRAPNGGGELLARLQSSRAFLFHGDLSNNFALLPELSYTLQASAKRR